jgi:DNA-binding CsgD family transcriptional regulator
LARAADVVGAICALPAVATQDWCERAAKALLPIRSDAVVCLTIAEFNDEGAIRFLEASGAVNGALGATPVETRLLRPPSARSLGWWIDRGSVGPQGRSLLLSQTNAAGWATSAAGKRWAELGFSDLIVALVPLGSSGTMRLLAIEMGVRPAAESFDEADAAVLAAVLPELSHRAMLAFGSTTSNPMNRITPREQLILDELSLGRTVKQIASTLGRSPHTIHDHVKSLHRKLGVSSRGELIARVLGHIGASEVSAGQNDDDTITVVHTHPLAQSA